MFGQKFFPYSTLQELNLDWILTKVKNILRFVPDDGVVGQILRRTPDGAEWSNETGGGGAVDSVNGQTGTVVLTASDVGALPDSYAAPVTSVNTKTGAVVLDKTDIGLGNVANVVQYSASNPPPYPVTSVNGQTGAVTVSTPTKTSDLNNDSGFITSAQAAAAAPVQSVNGQTGAVTIPTAIPSVIVDDTSTTGNNYTIDKIYTVTGSGIIIVFASCASDQNDSGWDAAYVLHNGTRIMAAGGRYTTTSTVTGAFASVPIAVSNGDTIQVSLSNTKVGDRIFYRRFLCFGGCTLS